MERIEFKRMTIKNDRKGNWIITIYYYHNFSENEFGFYEVRLFNFKTLEKERIVAGRYLDIEVEVEKFLKNNQ